MAHLLIVDPEDYFHTLFQTVLAQASCVAVEAADNYEGLLAAARVCQADGRMDTRYLVEYWTGV